MRKEHGQKLFILRGALFQRSLRLREQATRLDDSSTGCANGNLAARNSYFAPNISQGHGFFSSRELYAGSAGDLADFFFAGNDFVARRNSRRAFFSTLRDE